MTVGYVRSDAIAMVVDVIFAIQVHLDQKLYHS